MKKTLIILGIILILLALAGVAFVYIYGVPKSFDEVFGRLTEADPADPRPVTPPDGQGTTTQDGTETPALPRLRQLTTRPVGGALFMGTETIRYMEKGTGHVYDVSVTSGTETLVSGTTLQRAYNAVFTPNGEMVAVTREVGFSSETVLGTITEEGSLDITTLPALAREVDFNASGTLAYFFVPGSDGGIAYAYDITKKSSARLFDTPLTQIHILWGSPTYVYTVPTATMTGYLYTIKNNALSYTVPGASGLTGVPYTNGIIATTYLGNTLRSFDITQGTIPAPLMPEKCAPRNKNLPDTLYCSTPLTLPLGTYPDDWYKGEVTFTDKLIRVEMPSRSVTSLSNLEEESGRMIDIIRIDTDTEGNYLYFINKIDNTLWFFDTTAS